MIRTEKVALKSREFPATLVTKTTLRRKVGNATAVILAILATGITIVPLLHILYVVIIRGFTALSPSVFIRTTSGIGGGLSNAIVGSLLIIAVSLLLTVPLGVLGGVYISEFAPPKIAEPLRMLANVLSGVPSIVVGYFGYVTMVIWLGWGNSLLAASIAMTVIMLPYVLRSTELAMSKIPSSLREASLALGATPSTTVVKVVMMAAIPGILTGLTLATGLGMGETAPLIYTAGWSDYMPTLHLTHEPVAYLTYVVWAFLNEPFASAHALAFAAALFLLVIILILNVGLRTLLDRKSIRW